MRINFVGGSGIMGGIHKPIFEKYGHEVLVTGRNSELTPVEAAKTCDLTIICVPISETERVIKEVAPHAKAIVDFTGIKSFPVEAMLRFSSDDCEVMGMHPLYGNVTKLNGKNVIVCETERTWDKCREIVKCFENEGAKIKKMDPKQHDFWIGGIAQNVRARLLETLALVVKDAGINIKALYEISPPPTRILLDLLARQVAEPSASLFKSMKEWNPFDREVMRMLKDNVNILSDKDFSKEIREMYGDEFDSACERGKKWVEGVGDNQ